MRQVPTYLIIGNGRVARHFHHYLSILDIPYLSWDRSHDKTLLQPLADKASHILFLISDGAIESLAREITGEAVKVHFSGSLVTDAAYGAHPLMTFGPEMYGIGKYKGTVFVIDKDAPDFGELLPGLPNAHVRLDPALKAKYHALCVMAGNFSCILWQKLFETFESELGLAHHIAYPYLRQQMENLMKDHKSALTGPLARGDQATLERNLKALEGDPFQKIYQSFVETYPSIKEKAHDEYP